MQRKSGAGNALHSIFLMRQMQTWADDLSDIRRPANRCTASSFLCRPAVNEWDSMLTGQENNMNSLPQNVYTTVHR